MLMTYDNLWTLGLLYEASNCESAPFCPSMHNTLTNYYSWAIVRKLSLLFVKSSLWRIIAPTYWCVFAFVIVAMQWINKYLKLIFQNFHEIMFNKLECHSNLYSAHLNVFIKNAIFDNVWHQPSIWGSVFLTVIWQTLLNLFTHTNVYKIGVNALSPFIFYFVLCCILLCNFYCFSQLVVGSWLLFE